MGCDRSRGVGRVGIDQSSLQSVYAFSRGFLYGGESVMVGCEFGLLAAYSVSPDPFLLLL